MSADTMTLSGQMMSDALEYGVLGQSGDITVHLGSNTFPMSPSNTLGNFTEATYPGYTPFTWDALPVSISGDTVSVTADTATFSGPSSGSATLGSVFFSYKTGSGSVGLLGSLNIPGAPIVLTTPLITISVACSLSDLDINFSGL